MKKDKLIHDMLKGLLMAAVAAAAIPMPELAFAQGANVGTSVSDVTSSLQHVPDIISAVFYIGGAAFCGAGLLKLKLHADNPTQNKLGEGLGRLCVGAGLLALPYASTLVINTFGFTGTGPTYQSFGTVS